MVVKMDIAVKKVELISWLTKLQDETILKKVEALRKSSIKEIYDLRTPGSVEELQRKLDQSEVDIKAGRIHTQEEVELYFKSKSDQ